jgi:hypothetical protein
MSEVKDQPKPTATESKKEVSYSDGYGEAWEKYVNAPEPTPTPEKKVEAKPVAEDDCPGCDKAEKERKAKEKVQAERKPYKILKVQGKDVPVYSEEELINLAQMGTDYTKKRQSDSEEKKRWEGEFQTKHDQLEELTDKFNKMMAGLKPGEAIPGIAPQPKVEPEKVDKNAIYAEYGIDPEYADAYQKKMIDDVIDLRKKASLYDTKLQQIENMTNKVILKEAMGTLGEVIKKAKEEFPLDEIMSEDGSENLTLKQFVALLKAKDEVARSRGQTIDINEIARETVRDLHYIQSKAKQTAAPDISDEMSEDDFMTKYPNLAKRLSVKLGDKAIVQHEAEEAKLPPSLETKRREVDLSAIPTKKPDTMSDFVDAGFSDPEVMAAFK